MAVNINVPSQVRTYANLVAFPATGALKTIYIAEDTNKTYRWTGSVYVEVSGADFSGYVPTSRTLTINGTTQDLSADRTFTISTGITIGTTTIASGTVGRVLFEGAGNVVQESAGLTYNDTTRVFTLLGPIGSVFQHTALTNYNGLGGFQLNVADGTERGLFKLNPTSGEVRIGASGSGYFPTFYAQGVEAMRIFASTRNVSIGTTTDAGFRLDVNGTARVQGQLSLGVTGTAGRVNLARSSNGTMIGAIYTSGNDLIIENGSQGIFFNSIGAERMRLAPSTGNLLIGTTTDVTSSIVTINSTTQGFLPPRMTNTQKLAIASPATGLVVYDTTLNKLCVRTASSWETITSL